MSAQIAELERKNAQLERENDILKKEVKELRRNIIHDPLTGAYTRYFMDDVIAKTIAEHHRHKRSWAVLMIDVDCFKEINDNYGHQYGDYVLQTIAHTMRENLRQNDFVVRYGGDEFLIFVSRLQKDAVFKIAEKCRKAIEKGDITTVTVGVAYIDGKNQQQTLADAVRDADEALYKAKQAGKNCVA